MLLRFGTFVLNESARQLTRAGANIHLTPKAFDLLLLFVSETPRVVTKTELHERLWPQTYVSDATLLGLVKEVRRALDDRDSQSPIIRTVHRVGYAFAPPVERISGEPPAVAHWIVLRSGPVPLRVGQNIVGRDPKSEVWIDSAEVSRRHACIRVEADRAYLEDLASKNGTTVLDKALAGEVALHDGDQVAFGSIVGIYRSSAAGMSTVTRTFTTPAGATVNAD